MARRVRGRVVNHFARGPSSHKASPFNTPFGTEVDEIVGLVDDMGIVFDNDDSVLFVNKSMKKGKERGDVAHMQADCWFVKKVKSMASVAPRKFTR